MTAYITKILIGTSVAASMSALSTTPVFATNLTRPTNIQFITNGVVNTSANQPNINTWNYAPGTPIYDNTGLGGVNRRVLNNYNNYGNISQATAALTDKDSTTNVELFTSSENATYHVGFTGKLGNNTIKIESLTQADWADGKLATGWLTGFRNAYGGLMSGIETTNASNMLKDFNSNFSSLVSYLSNNGLKTGGDPNIGDVTYNKKTKDLKIDLVGHLDLTGSIVDTRKTIIDTRPTIRVNGRNVNNPNQNKSIPNPNYLIGTSPDFNRNSTGNVILDTMLFRLGQTPSAKNKPLQLSEIAKVTFNNQVSYAYSFAAIDSGAIAGDRNKTTSDHTGIYSWSNNYKTASVPEPSALLGLMSVAGLVLAKHKVRKNISC